MNRGESMDGLLCLTLFNTLLVILCVSFQWLLTTFSHGGHLSRPLLIIMNHHKMHVSHIPHSSDCPGTSVLICVVVFSRPFQNKSDEIIMFPGEIQKFLWYSYGIPMVFLWFSYGFNRFYGGPLHQESSKWRWSLWCSCFSMTRSALASDVANEEVGYIPLFLLGSRNSGHA